MLLHPHAKINLALHILRKREDGYHDIQTIFHRVELHDTITLAGRERGISLRCNLRYIPTDERNLCVRAAKLLLDAAGFDGGVSIDLVKRIPVGAGLGGGSSDAAAILRSLPAFLGFQLPSQTIHEIALSLGSDIPFFLDKGSAYATGRGEVLQYFVCTLPYWILIVYPGVHVSTRWAYGNLRINSALPHFDIKEFFLDHLSQPTSLVNRLRNDFEPLVFSHYEEVLRTKEILYRTGADFALMSGSGSAVFGLYSSQDYAMEAREFFQPKFPVSLTPANWTPEE